ncbi:MAG TPA: hydroxylamine reductase, partial [Phycisphaerae bacterium]|nr:hydroxylamine reductase [Phycisphaerae bacterium]
MFCFQCEQTAGGRGCTKHGVCGKDPAVAALQDLLVYAAKAIAMYARRARDLGASSHDVNIFTLEALFTTVTNVNFDARCLVTRLKKAGEILQKAKSLYEYAADKAGVTPENLDDEIAFDPSDDLEDMIEQSRRIGIESRRTFINNDDILGLQELLTYGLKGMAAYADHAMILGMEDQSVYAFIHEALDFLTGPKNKNVNELVNMCLRCGEMNLKTMALLDAANTEAYGHPEPTQVRITPVKGKAILVSGHDLKDLAMLLDQTQDTGIKVYTHGEMLPCHGYPLLNQYPHLVGNYGGAWQDQQKEFAEFPGAILMTTNCIQRPAECYKDRIFTTGLVAWPGVKHINNSDFTPVIEAALAAEGFVEDAPEKSIMVGFGHAAVMKLAPMLIEAVKSGGIRHFFLIGGCDGAKSGRNYYTEFALAVPNDCVIMTLACGKYRFNKLDFGTIGGIPRLLDIGQCNDAYSAIRIAGALAEAFNCDVNKLPLSIILSWYEQKAVGILLTLLHLGIKNIRLGPSLPACVTPNVFKVLTEKFNIMPIST